VASLYGEGFKWKNTQGKKKKKEKKVALRLIQGQVLKERREKEKRTIAGEERRRSSITGETKYQ